MVSNAPGAAPSPEEQKPRALRSRPPTIRDTVQANAIDRQTARHSEDMATLIESNRALLQCCENISQSVKVMSENVEILTRLWAGGAVEQSDDGATEPVFAYNYDYSQNDTYDHEDYDDQPVNQVAVSNTNKREYQDQPENVAFGHFYSPQKKQKIERDMSNTGNLGPAADWEEDVFPRQRRSPSPAPSSVDLGGYVLPKINSNRSSGHYSTGLLNAESLLSSQGHPAVLPKRNGIHGSTQHATVLPSLGSLFVNHHYPAVRPDSDDSRGDDNTGTTKFPYRDHYLIDAPYPADHLEAERNHGGDARPTPFQVFDGDRGHDDNAPFYKTGSISWTNPFHRPHHLTATFEFRRSSFLTPPPTTPSPLTVIEKEDKTAEKEDERYEKFTEELANSSWNMNELEEPIDGLSNWHYNADRGRMW